MPWTATLVDAKPDPNNPQNILAHVQVTNGAEVINVYPRANDLNATNLKRWLHTIIVQNLAARDTALPSLIPLIGQTMTVEAPPPPDANLETFKNRWRRLMKLKALSPVNAAIVTQRDNLQTQVETFLAANPTAIDQI